ncbi:MAG: hypothetical protein ACPGGB_01900, partial [Flavobacteriales bacterium]
MNKTFFAVLAGVLLVAATGCTTTTTRSTQLAEGVALLDIEPVKARCVVDTTQTLQAVSQTRTVLGFFRSGDREFAQYPGMVFRLGPAMRERRAAVHKALKGTDFDVMVNPSEIIPEWIKQYYEADYQDSPILVFGSQI